MALRKWIVRGIVWGIVGACAAGAVAYQRWTNAAAVREQVIAQLSLVFPGAHVSVDSAQLHVLGFIKVTGLRFTRRDDPGRHEFLHVPSAIFYHDKEKILDGELRLRKIELNRPRLRVRRGRDGKWNLQGLTRKPTGEAMQPMPALIIHHGILIVEDRSDPAKATMLEINDIGVTVVNDPLPRIAIRGAANSDLVGKLHLHGSFDRQTNESHLNFRASQIPLTHSLLGRIPVQLPAEFFVGLQLSAKADAEGKVSYHPSQAQPWYYDIQFAIKEGRVEHNLLPLPLEGLQIKAHCNTGTLRLESLTARSGKTEIVAHGVGQLPRVDQEFEVQLDLKHVQLGEELARKLPKKISDLHKLFDPNGPTTIHIACARHEGQWVSLASGEPSQVSLRPEFITLSFKGFPYLLERAKGDVDYNLLTKHVRVDLTAQAGDRPVILQGHWNGEGAEADVRFDIRADNIPIDEKLLKALQPGLREVVQSFHANGRFDVRSHIQKDPGKPFRNEFHIHIHDAAVRWDHFPYPLEKVSGFLDIYPEHWEFHDFQGTHKDGHVLLNGKSIPRIQNGTKTFGISLEISGRNISLDDTLRDSLLKMPQMYNAWETFNPTGKLFFTAAIDRPSQNLNELDIQVDASGCTAKPKFFPYRIQDISGKFRFRRMRLEIARLRAKHEKALIALDHGTVDLHPRGGYYAKFEELQMQGLRLDEEFIQALPGKLQTAARALRLQDALRVKTKLIIAQPQETGKPPDVYWDGQIWMYGVAFTTGLEFTNATGTLACVGRYDGRQIVGVDGNLTLDRATLFNQPFKNVHAKFQMRDKSPDVLLIGLRAPIFSGDVTGQIRVEFNSSLRYEMNLTASQINLAEFGRHNLGPKSQIAGAASARLYLSGLASGHDTLEGNGSIDIPRGHLYNLPFLLDLLKFLGLHWPDRTAFEEFHAGFAVQGSKVNVQRLDLLGSAISLSGKGEFDLTSRKLALDVYPMWGRVEQLLPPMVRPLPTTFSKNLLTVEVRGKVTGSSKDLRFRMKPMPVIVDPILLLRDRLIGRPK